MALPTTNNPSTQSQSSFVLVPQFPGAEPELLATLVLDCLIKVPLLPFQHPPSLLAQSNNITAADYPHTAPPMLPASSGLVRYFGIFKWGIRFLFLFFIKRRKIFSEISQCKELRPCLVLLQRASKWNKKKWGDEEVSWDWHKLDHNYRFCNSYFILKEVGW